MPTPAPAVVATKSSITAMYVELLVEAYPKIYAGNESAQRRVREAASDVLSGKYRMNASPVWDAVLKAHGLSPRATLKTLAALPD